MVDILGCLGDMDAYFQGASHVLALECLTPPLSWLPPALSAIYVVAKQCQLLQSTYTLYAYLKIYWVIIGTQAASVASATLLSARWT
jgi:hypothetical protein